MKPKAKFVVKFPIRSTAMLSKVSDSNDQQLVVDNQCVDLLPKLNNDVDNNDTNIEFGNLE